MTYLQAEGKRILLKYVLTFNLVVLKYGYIRQIALENYIEREIFSEIIDHIDKPEITLITGSRQVGKTVLMEQAIAYLINKRSLPSHAIYSYNMDLIRDWEMFQDQSRFIEFLAERTRNGKIYVFVDEAQKVPEAARFFKGVFDSKMNAKLFLTGSSSLEIKAKFKETLAGRKRIFHVPPFTFIEFLSAKDKTLHEYIKEGKELGSIDLQTAIRLYKEYLTFGGYPRVVLSESSEEKKAILHEIYSSYVEQDALGFLEIKNKTAFNRLVRLLSAQVGQLVNIGELSVHLGIDRSTVERYLQALEETFIIKRIAPYFRNPRQEIVKAGKIYFLDSGIRHLVLDNFMPFDEKTDKGLVHENGVFIELHFRLRNTLAGLHFWRTKQGAEVDFVIEEGLNLIPIETKATIKQETIPTGLRSFIEKFKPHRAFVANLSIGNSTRGLHNTVISFIYPFEIMNTFKKA